MNEKIDINGKHQIIHKKIFLSNEEAEKFVKSLKRRGKYPFKHIVVEW